jgi:Mg-chelatase subunit ChlD
MATLSVDFLTLQPVPTNGESMVPCAVKLVAPDTAERTPTHFILLLDISESMSTDNKLENCKRCAELMLNFMSGEDRISLITFGEDATLHLKRVPADESHKTSIQSTIKGLRVNGCTNLSAGLGYVREVCEGPAAADQKAGLLILTDGHANRGVSGTTELRAIITSLRESFSHLSVHCVAYGADHNENLMRGIAEDSSGSYNVVNTIEDTAVAFGETLGGLLSCAFQNVVVELPSDCVVKGPQKKTVVGDRLQVRIGDIYSGTKPLILFDMPSVACRSVDAVFIKGMRLPTLESFTITPVQQLLTERDKDIEMTKLRYDCVGILEAIRALQRPTDDQVSAMEARIAAFETKVRDTFFDGHAVATLLRAEVTTMRDLLRNIRTGHYTHYHDVTTAQHVTSLGLGRGFCSPSASAAPPRHGGRLARQYAAGALAPAATGAHVASDDEDEPTTCEANGTEAAPEISVFQNRMQSQIAALMRTASSQHQ